MSGLGNKEIMARNLKRLLYEKDMNQMDLCSALGFKYMTVSDWLHAKSYPRIDKIEMMANYFGVQKSDLIEDKSGQTSEPVSSIKQELNRQIEVLTDDQAAALLVWLKSFLNK